MNSEKYTIKTEFYARGYIFLSCISIATLAATFLISNTDLRFTVKLIIFAALVFGYIFSCVWFYRRQMKKSSKFIETENSQTLFDAEIEGKLLALEEVHQFFAASLKSADMFRLIVNRVNEIIPNSECVFFLPDKINGRLQISEISSNKLREYINLQIKTPANFVEKCFRSGKTQTENKFLTNYNSTKSFVKYNSAIAVPLIHAGNIYGLFALYSEREAVFENNAKTLFEAVAVRIAPLLYSSQTFEQNVNNALTDALTGLPNERGFFLVLENQIAEAQRYRNERPLTVLAMDVKNFDEHNRRFGHANGDQLLIFAADTIKKQLRGMDLLARSKGDEFIAVLPTASDEITREIIERIERAFISTPFTIQNHDKIHLQLCFGAASFERHGETSESLLKFAISQKELSKLSKKDGNILRFPKEYVN